MRVRYTPLALPRISIYIARGEPHVCLFAMTITCVREFVLPCAVFFFYYIDYILRPFLAQYSRIPPVENGRSTGLFLDRILLILLRLCPS